MAYQHPVASASSGVARPILPLHAPRHWYIMLDCRFREPVERSGGATDHAPFWARVLPGQKMRGYYRCFGLTAETKEAARRLAVDDTIHNPYFLLNVAEIEVVELEEVSRDDALFQRCRPAESASMPDMSDPIWFRDGGGYYC